MKDDLKKYLNEHREEFELETPSKDIWQKINADLHAKPKSTSKLYYLKIAASLIIAMGIGMYFMTLLSNQPDSTVETINPSSDQLVNPLADISTDLAEVETYYVQKVNLQMRELKRYEVDEDMMIELEELKSEFEELKIEVGIGADQSMVVEAMIDNYRLRLKLLEDLLEAVKDNRVNNNENENKI